MPEDEIINDYLNEIPNNDIAKKYGISLNKLGYILRKNSVNRRGYAESAKLKSDQRRTRDGISYILRENGKLTSIKSGAKMRDLEFQISLEEIWALYESQNKRCALTGVEIAFKDGEMNGENTASLDRIDSSRGYVAGNIQWVHKDINLMKGSLSQEDFISLCHTISDHQESIKNKDLHE
jgi:hypothetical protein